MRCLIWDVPVSPTEFLMRSLSLSFCSSLFFFPNSANLLSETDVPGAVLCLYKTDNDCFMKFTYSEHASGKSVLTALKEPGQWATNLFMLHPYCSQLKFFLPPPPPLPHLGCYFLLRRRPVQTSISNWAFLPSPTFQSAEAVGPTLARCCWQWLAASCSLASCCSLSGRWSSPFMTGGSLHASRVHAHELDMRW